MAENGETLVVITSNSDYLSIENPSDRDSFDVVDGVEVRRLNCFFSHHRSHFFRALSYVAFMIRSFAAGLRLPDIDVVVGTSPPLSQALSAMAVAKLRRCPFIIEVRDLWPDVLFEMGVIRSPLLRRILSVLEVMFYRHACMVLVNSPGYVSAILDKGIDRERIRVIPNGVDPDIFCVDRDNSNRGDEQNGGFIVLYAGAVGLANNVGLVLNVAERLAMHKDIRFVIVGGGGEFGFIREEIERRNLENVSLQNAVPKRDMRKLIEMADVCLVTLMNKALLKLSLPNKMFDYMALGKPTVLAVEGVAKEVMEASGGGVCTPQGDFEAMAGALLKLKREPELRKAMGQAAKEYVLKNYNRRHQSRLFAACLTEASQVRI